MPAQASEADGLSVFLDAGRGATGRIPLPDGRERWVVELGLDEDGQALEQPAPLAEFLSARIGRAVVQRVSFPARNVCGKLFV